MSDEIESQNAETKPSRRGRYIVLGMVVLFLVALAGLYALTGPDSKARGEIRDLGGFAGEVPLNGPNPFSEWLPFLDGREEIVMFKNVDLNKEQLKDLSNALRNYSSIGVVQLKGKEVTDDWIEAIGELDHVKHLLLIKTSVTPEALENLNEWDNLEFFNALDCPAISEEQNDAIRNEAIYNR